MSKSSNQLHTDHRTPPTLPPETYHVIDTLTAPLVRVYTLLALWFPFKRGEDRRDETQRAA